MDRLSITLPDVFDFSTEIQPLTRDINPAGHIGNDTLVSYLNETLHRFLRTKNIPMTMTIMADLAIMYRSEAFYGDTLKCEVAVNDFTRDSCHFYYRIGSGRSAEILKARTRVVFFDYEQKKRVAVPEVLKALRDS